MKYEKREKEVVKKFYTEIIKEWKESKKAYDKDLTLQEAYKEASKLIDNLSPYSFSFVYRQMQKHGLDGYPVLDTKIFHMWAKEGYKVKKGEHSLITGISWKEVKKEEEIDGKKETKEFMIPKVYKLFHRSQVEKKEVKK